MSAVLAVALASRSETGARTHNEDQLQHGEVGDGWYAVLADGAGGHRQGALAAELVVRMAALDLAQRAAQGGLHPAALGDIVRGAHEALNRRQQGLGGLERMHATLVLLWIDKARQQAMWSHAGDSRLYLLRQGRIERVTRDDSVVQSMVDAGLLDEAQARGHPQRNRLLAALGSEDEIEPHCMAEPLALQDGDAFLLCSDGWHDTLEPGEIEASLARAHSADDWLDAMKRSVQSRAQPHQDNFSAIAVWVGSPAEVTRIRAS
jgi:serine/threonine protein phosphatase PrpC